MRGNDSTTVINNTDPAFPLDPLVEPRTARRSLRNAVPPPLPMLCATTPWE